MDDLSVRACVRAYVSAYVPTCVLGRREGEVGNSSVLL